MKYSSRLSKSQIPSQRMAIRVSTRFNEAISLHQAGRLHEAQAIYEEILRLQPNHFDALHFLGLIELHYGNPQQAINLINQAIALHPLHAAYHANLGMAHRALGRLEEAVTSYDRALAINPVFLEALYNRGNALGELGRLDEAVLCFDKAITIQPYLIEAHFFKANALKELGQFEPAVTAYDKTIELKTDHAEALYNRGLVLKKLKRPCDALTSIELAISAKPDYVEAYCIRGTLLMDLGRMDEAKASFCLATTLKPDYAEAHYCYGLLLGKIGDQEAALTSYDLAISTKENFPEALNNRSNILSELGRLAQATADIKRAIAIRPDYAEAHMNHGNLLKVFGHTNDAMSSYDRAIDLKPEYVDAHYNKSLLLLLLGQFEMGWPLYESRWESSCFSSQRRDFSQPMWLGDTPLIGKRILLHAEQGLGDTIQFCRYASKVADLGAHVLLEVQKPLLALLQQLDKRIQVISAGEPLPHFDYHCPLLSLPLAFNTNLQNIPTELSYLRIMPDKISAWVQRIGHKSRPRIGLVWSGNAQHANDTNRSIALSVLLAHLPDDFEFFSLQKEVRATDMPTLNDANNLRHYGDELADFTDTAALCTLMDIVISVDTSVAHLSAALGLPTWILLPTDPDWRWLLNRDNSPWYPSARLFRQSIRGDWVEVVKRIAVALTAIKA